MSAMRTVGKLDAAALTPAPGALLTEYPLGSRPPRSASEIRVGLDREGRLPAVAAEDFDLLLTTASVNACASHSAWVRVDGDLDDEFRRLQDITRHRPLASATLAQVLRATERLALPDALVVESLAYSTLLAGAEFRDWRRSRPLRDIPSNTQPRVRFTRQDDDVCLYLANPSRRNAFDARMRDDLVEALQGVIDDPSVRSLTLRGDGPSFSSGGDLDEFGTTPDPAIAHAIRVARSPALLIHRLERMMTTAHLQGPCIGAGIEVPAAAKRVVAERDASFQLPEIRMGLIPGAGGTATIARRIGRHRTLYLALSGRAIDATTAMTWGLVDDIEERH